MSELWLYVDESGQEDGTFRVGVLASMAPITDALTAPVLEEIAAHHPNARVLQHGFHAKDDPDSVRRAFYRAIRAAELDALFVERLRHQGQGRWISEVDMKVSGGMLPSHPYLPGGPGAANGPVLQQALSGSVLAHFLDLDCDALHLSMEERSTIVTTETASAWVEDLQVRRLRLAAANPLVPFRFPPILLTVTSKTHRAAGQEVCDYLLWAIQRACNPKASLAERRSWMRQVRLIFAASFSLGGPWAGTERKLGRGLSLPFSTPLPMELEPSAFSRPWIRIRRDEIAVIVTEASRLADHGERRLAHLRDLLRAVRKRSVNEDAVPLLGAAFLLVCDTLPSYEPTDAFGHFDVCHRRAVAGLMCTGGDWESSVRHFVKFARAHDLSR
jgi:hypothetical protein